MRKVWTVESVVVKIYIHVGGAEWGGNMDSGILKVVFCEEKKIPHCFWGGNGGLD